mmetsp:Transcript_6453/g.11261  ORF Transcript_6453/g.11261 Transcript_6453/m.11261 type:complete len:532 (-) Transcript_6453:220-1815(-)
MAYSDLYSEQRVIGRGNFGTVHLVQSRIDHQLYVAKKILLAGMSAEQLLATKREVAVLKKLNHPHIVQYIENFIEDEHLIIIMEYCDSGDISKKITTARDQRRPITEDVVLHWLLQASLALEFMHENRILHRDIKSSNIFLTSKNTVKLGDFGISRVLEHTNSVALTMVGTPYYMSPEVCASQPYDTKSDVWSLGCVAYELCNLNYPFISANLLGLIVKISNDEPNPLPSCYSKDLRNLINAMLRKAPSERLSMKQVLESDVMTSYILNMELPSEGRPRSEETPRKRMIRLKQEKALSQADFHKIDGRNSVEVAKFARMRHQELIYGSSSDSSSLLKTVEYLRASEPNYKETVKSPSGLTDTCSSSDLPDTSDSFELSNSLASEDFSLSRSGRPEDRPIRASGFYDIEAVIKKSQSAESDSDDEPYEDLQANTVGQTSILSKVSMQELTIPPKFSDDRSQYEVKLAHMRSTCIKALGEENFIKLYEYTRNCIASNVPEESMTKEATRHFGRNGKAMCFLVAKLVFMEDYAW